tara:strand:- start:233 stop:1210 length:978 start_codon:yes stop_codon:yes gene_type:complete
MEIFKQYNELLNPFLEDFKATKSSQNLYLPINYILELGGKRIRPFLTLMVAESFGAKPKEALSAALSVEVFHNFTLMHDDIMDDAPLRRGKTTVHEKWDINTAILSGDAMLIRAYQLLEDYPPLMFVKLNKLLSRTALEVCEGQQYDIDFEKLNDVSQEDYIEMIRLKTAVLVGCAMKMGAAVALAPETDCQLFYDFGIQLGLAFQLQDDYLDAFGNPETFGKQVGGDILENKKTILYHLALKKGTQQQQDRLNELLSSGDEIAPNQKIIEVKALFEVTEARSSTRDLISHYAKKADEKLGAISISEQQKQKFVVLKQWLMNRDH